MATFAQRFGARRSVAPTEEADDSDVASQKTTSRRRGSSQRRGLDSDEEAEHLGALRRRLRKSAGGGRESSFDQRVRTVRDRIRSMMVGESESSDETKSAPSQPRRSRSSAAATSVEPEPADELEEAASAATPAISVASAPSVLTTGFPATSRRASRRAERLSTASEYYIGVVDVDADATAPTGTVQTPADVCERPRRASRSPSASLVAPEVDSWCRGHSIDDALRVVGRDCDALEGSRVRVIDTSSCMSLYLEPTGTIIEVRCDGQRVRVEHDGEERAQRYYNTGKGGEHQLFLLEPVRGASPSSPSSRRPSAISALSLSATSGNSQSHANSNPNMNWNPEEPEEQMGGRGSRRSLSAQDGAPSGDTELPNNDDKHTTHAEEEPQAVESAFAERRRRRSARLSAIQAEEGQAASTPETEAQPAIQATKQSRGSSASRQNVSQPLVPRRRSTRPPSSDVNTNPSAAQPANAGRQSPRPSSATLEVPQEATGTGSSNSTSLLRRYSKRSTTSRSTEGRGSRPPSPTVSEEVSPPAEAKPPAKVRLSKASRASCASVASPACSDAGEVASGVGVGRRASKATGTKKASASSSSQAVTPQPPLPPPPPPPPPAPPVQSEQSSAFQQASPRVSTSAKKLQQQPVASGPQPDSAERDDQQEHAHPQTAWLASPTNPSSVSQKTACSPSESLISLEARFTEQLNSFREELAREMGQLEERAVTRALSEMDRRLQKEAAALSAKVLAISQSPKVPSAPCANEEPEQEYATSADSPSRGSSVLSSSQAQTQVPPSSTADQKGVRTFTSATDVSNVEFVDSSYRLEAIGSAARRISASLGGPSKSSKEKGTEVDADQEAGDDLQDGKGQEFSAAALEAEMARLADLRRFASSVLNGSITEGGGPASSSSARAPAGQVPESAKSETANASKSHVHTTEKDLECRSKKVMEEKAQQKPSRPTTWWPESGVPEGPPVHPGTPSPTFGWDDGGNYSPLMQGCAESLIDARLPTGMAYAPSTSSGNPAARGPWQFAQRQQHQQPQLSQQQTQQQMPVQPQQKVQSQQQRWPQDRDFGDPSADAQQPQFQQVQQQHQQPQLQQLRRPQSYQQLQPQQQQQQQQRQQAKGSQAPPMYQMQLPPPPAQADEDSGWSAVARQSPRTSHSSVCDASGPFGRGISNTARPPAIVAAQHPHKHTSTWPAAQSEWDEEDDEDYDGRLIF